MCTYKNSLKKGKTIPETGRGGPHFLDNRLADDGKVVSLTACHPLPPRKIPGTHFS
jgi:hypothetical protein